MTHAIRTLFRFWVGLLALAVVVQVGLAGYGAFSADHKASDHSSVTHKQFDHGFNPHIALGYLIFLATVVLLLLALIGRLGRRLVLQGLGAVVLVLLTIVLAIAGGSVPLVGVFHPLIAFAVVGLIGKLAHGEWAGAKTG
jgi:hypothetical protein